jgi:hypothetical protein
MKVLNENRIGTALWKDSVPAKYKQYPIIGQGATSLVLDYSPDTVLILTRDSMKKDWLIHKLDCDLVETLDIYHRKSRALGEMPVYVIKAPKLFPLSAKNKRAIKHAILQYNEIVYGQKSMYVWGVTPKNREKTLPDSFRRYLDQVPDGLFSQLINFLLDYDTSQYHEDFLMRNFMEDRNGNVVLIDPVVDAELLAELRRLASSRY